MNQITHHLNINNLSYQLNVFSLYLIFVLSLISCSSSESEKSFVKEIDTNGDSLFYFHRFENNRKILFEKQDSTPLDEDIFLGFKINQNINEFNNTIKKNIKDGKLFRYNGYTYYKNKIQGKYNKYKLIPIFSNSKLEAIILELYERISDSDKFNIEENLGIEKVLEVFRSKYGTQDLEYRIWSDIDLGQSNYFYWLRDGKEISINYKIEKKRLPFSDRVNFESDIKNDQNNKKNKILTFKDLKPVNNDGYQEIPYFSYIQIVYSIRKNKPYTIFFKEHIDEQKIKKNKNDSIRQEEQLKKSIEAIKNDF